MPSATSAAPTSSRNDSASILTVGWALTKRAVGSAASSMTAIAITIAATMIGTWSAMPIAVITELSENTRSSSTIWVITAAKLAVPATLSPLWPSSMWCISIVPLTIRNRPPPASTMSRQETAKSHDLEDRLGSGRSSRSG